MTDVNRPDSSSGCVLSGNSRATFGDGSQAGSQPLARSLCWERNRVLFPINVFLYSVVKSPSRQTNERAVSHPWDLNP